jgi:hypothetical protein
VDEEDGRGGRKGESGFKVGVIMVFLPRREHHYEYTDAKDVLDDDFRVS